MTLQDAVKALAAIRGAARRGDDDVAHSLEDELRTDVLAAIANGNVEGTSPALLAAVALSSSEIGFMRHCA